MTKIDVFDFEAQKLEDIANKTGESVAGLVEWLIDNYADELETEFTQAVTESMWSDREAYELDKAMGETA